MSERAPSFQEVVRRRQRSAFVGRESEIETLVQNLRAPVEERALLISITGQGGMGKTFLARRFADMARHQGFAVGWSDESEGDAVAVMAALARDLGERHFRALLDGERLYRTRRHEIESDPDVPSALLESLGSMLGRGGVRLARHAPAVGVAFELVSEDTAAEVGRQAASAAGFIARKLKDQDEIALVSDPLAVLTPRFVAGLAQVAKERGTVLCFDTYEATRLTVEGWLRELLDGTYGELPGDLLVVLAGRDSLDPNVWADYEAVTLPMPIEAFAPDASRTYLNRHGITDPAIVETIVESAQGLPLLLATLAAHPPSDSRELGDAADTATERFLKWLANDDHRQVALRAAIPRAFDLDVLAVLLESQEAAASALDWLRQMPFVTRRRDGWRYHDVVRSMFGSKLRHESPQAWSEANERMARAFREGQRMDAVEAAYHAVAANRRHLGEAVMPMLLAWARDDRQRALGLAQAMRQGLADAGQDDTVGAGLVDALSQDGTTVKIASALEALVDAEGVTLNHEVLAPIHLLVALDSVERDPERARRHASAALATGKLQMAAHAINAMVAMAVEEWDVARTSSEEAVALLGVGDEDGYPIEFLAALYGVRAAAAEATGDLDTALASVESALELAPEEGNFRAAHAAALAKQGRHREALEEFEQALEWGVQLEHQAREDVAHLRQLLGEPDGWRGFLDALRSDPDCLSCWREMARALKEIPSEEARRLLDDVPVGVGGPQARFGRALVLDLIGNRAEAIEIVDELVASPDAFAEVLVVRALLHVEDGEEEQAVELLRRAEAASESDDELTHVIKAFGRVGRDDDVERCATTLLARAPAPWLWLTRCTARRMRGDVDGALEDLRRAEGGDPGDVQLLAWRAEMARDLSAHDLAAADAVRWGEALDLEEELASDAVNRLGLLLSHLGRWDDALARLEQAVAGDPDGLAARYNRLVVLVRRDGAERHADDIAQLLRWLDARELPDPARTYARSGIAALRGEADRALGLLESACGLVEEIVEWARWDRAFDGLRDDARFTALLSPLGR